MSDISGAASGAASGASVVTNSAPADPEIVLRKAVGQVNYFRDALTAAGVAIESAEAKADRLRSHADAAAESVRVLSEEKDRLISDLAAAEEHLSSLGG